MHGYSGAWAVMRDLLGYFAHALGKPYAAILACELCYALYIAIPLLTLSASFARLCDCTGWRKVI